MGLPQHTSNPQSEAGGGDASAMPMPIAVVGMGCRLPGGASNAEKLWDFVLNKKTARTEVPSERFNAEAFYHPNADKNGTLNVRAGNFLPQDEISRFDAPFFSISPAEALAMDPMQRLLLEVVYEATENAGIPLEKLSGTNTGCYVGCFTSDYDQISKRDPETLPKYHAIGTGQAILSNRISFCFDLKGPSVTLDTACSSSIVALHLACQSLRTGEASSAIVGATHAILNPDVMVGMTNLHFLSPDATCYTFDSRANGYARGEGIAALVLKPLDDAIRDGDTVRAVIRGTAVNSNGRNPGITLPSREAQVRLIESAYQQARCDPSLTRYCEAHGTGTQAGDPREAGAIGETLGAAVRGSDDGVDEKSDSDGGDYCFLNNKKVYVGSVKTNIGHLEGASGLAGLIKAVKSVESGIIAPNLNFEKGNPDIDFEGWNIAVPTEPTPWPQPGLRRASVNSFGYGGTNGHVIIDDAYHFMLERGLKGKHRTALPESNKGMLTNGGGEAIYTTPERRPRIFHISARESSAVSKYAEALSEYVSSHIRSTTSEEEEQTFLRNLAHTLSDSHRTHHEHGQIVVASSRQQLLDGLQDVIDSSPTSRAPNPPGIGLIFTGQGAQWWAMGRELFHLYPDFAASLSACDKAVASFYSSSASWTSLLDELLDRDQRSSRINQAELSQPLCTALQIGLVDLLVKSWGIVPHRVVGHSSGEIAAAYATGALGLEDAMRVAYYRGLLSSKIGRAGAHQGGMMAVTLSEEEAKAEVDKVTEVDDIGKVVVACVNSPRSVTISGDLKALTKLQQSLTARGIFARRLQVETAYHSHHMLTLADEYRDALAEIQVVPWSERKPVAMFSSVWEREVTSEDDLGPQYWVDNMVSCVRFSGALAQLSQQPPSSSLSSTLPPTSVLVELGPHSALAGPVKQILALTVPDIEQSPIKYLSALLRGRDAAITALTTAGSLYLSGCRPDLAVMNGEEVADGSSPPPSLLIDLPNYSWNHSRSYWSESRLSKDYRFRAMPRTDLLGAPFLDWNPMEPRWRNFIRMSEQPWVKSHVVQGAVVYPAAGFCCMALEAASQMTKLQDVSASLNSPSVVAEYKIRDFVISRALVIPSTDEGVEVSFSMRRPDTATSQHDKEKTYDFRVFSYTNETGWAEHCSGRVSAAYNRDDEEEEESVSAQARNRNKQRLDLSRGICNMEIKPNTLYTGLNDVGLYYGPEFQGISEIAAGQDQTYGTVTVTDTASTMPNQFEFERLMHPATMDTFLQASIAAVTNGEMGNLKQPYVPISVKEITVSAGLDASAGKKFYFTTQSTRKGARKLESSAVVLPAQGEAEDVSSSSSAAGVVMEGIQLVAIASGSSDSGLGNEEIPNHTAVPIWQPDIDLLSQEQLNNMLRESVPKDSVNGARMRSLELLAYSYFDRVLNELTDADYQSMHPHHQKFYRYMKHQRDLVLTNQHEQQTESWTNLTRPDVVAQLDQIKSDIDRDDDYEGKMFVRMGERLVSVLRKEVEPLALMMEDNLLYNYYTVALGTHGTYPQIAKYVSLLSHKYPDLDYLEIGAGTGGCTVPVLEALAGNGARSYPRMKSYTYTDISSGFFEQASAKFADWAGMMEFAKLDVEHDPREQDGFRDDGRRFDVIIAANVLHATYDMDRTIRHTRSLLRPGGKLILLDMTHSVLSVSLIFGNLPGWWNCSEPWREYGPLLTEQQWQDVLERNDFTDLQASSPDVQDPLEEQTRVIVASAVDGSTNAMSANSNDNGSSSSTSPTVTKILIVEPEGRNPNNLRLVESLRDMIQRKSLRGPIETTTCTLSESPSHLSPGTAVISLAELDEPVLASLSSSTAITDSADSSDRFAAIQSLVTNSSVAGLLWVTRGATTSRPELSLFHGLARSLRAENEGRPCLTLDLDLDTTQALESNEGGDEANVILSVLYQGFSSSSPSSTATLGTVDREFVVRDRRIPHILRAVENDRLNRLVASKSAAGSEFSASFLAPEMRDLSKMGRPLRAFTTNLKGQGHEEIVFDTHPSFTPGSASPLDDDQVEISIRAAVPCSTSASSSTDVTEIPGGGGCAGIISAVGKTTGSRGGEEFKIGDPVFAWCPDQSPLATLIRIHTGFVRKLPDPSTAGDALAAAALLAPAQVQAHHALMRVARIRTGDAILVSLSSAAATATVLAALVLAAREGCRRVCGVVGSEWEKKRLLRLIGVAAATGNTPIPDILLESELTAASATSRKGLFDVVLKCDDEQGYRSRVTDETLWGAVASFGRFIKVGGSSKNSTTATSLPSSNTMAARNLTYTATDVSTLAADFSDMATDIFAEAFATLDTDGRLPLILPTIMKPFSQIGDAFLLSKDGKRQRSKTTKKQDENQERGIVVFEPKAGDMVPVIPQPLSQVDLVEDASYLLVGGLGGLGRSISRWMAEKGARNLIYVSRRGAASAEAQETIRDLQSRGVHTTVLECDVADEAAFSAVLSSALETLPPLRGVLQGAMVLRDQVFANMTLSNFTACIRPKVQGSWSVHRATLGQPLDFFVLLSSCASVWGNAGQSNYAAGCTYQGALAAYRRSLGLPATSFDIGKVANVGFVAENAGTTSEQNLVRIGLVDVSEPEFLTMLELAMVGGSANSAAVTEEMTSHIPSGHLVTGVHSTNAPDELPFWSRDPVFSHMDFVRPHLKKASSDSQQQGQDQKSATLPLPTLLSQSTTQAEAESLVLVALRRKMARVLMMGTEDDVDARKPMANFGVDSLIAVDLRNWFTRECGVDVPVFDVLQAASLTGLAAKVARGDGFFGGATKKKN